VEVATRKLANPVALETYEDRDLLIVPKQAEGGFEFQIECMDYGVYPSAEGWRVGCWDVTVWTPNLLKECLSEFISSLIMDAALEIHYSNQKPHKWILYYWFEGERVADEYGLLFFNWFGERMSKTLCNGVAT